VPDALALHHVGIVVADADASAGALAHALGTGPPFSFNQRCRALIDGAPVDFALRLSFIWLGTALAEFSQPLDDRSLHAAFLAAGGGLHHVAFQVESIASQLARCDNPRCRVDATISGPDLRWVYAEIPREDGLLVELIERTPAIDAAFRRIRASVGAPSCPSSS
jgi:hypothetical protein